jgi:hypothetical protein
MKPWLIDVNKEGRTTKEEIRHRIYSLLPFVSLE